MPAIPTGTPASNSAPNLNRKAPTASRLKDGSRRITHITSVEGMETDIITLLDVFLFDFHAGLDEHGRHRGVLRSTGLRPRFVDTLADRGVALPAEIFASEGFGK